MPGLPDEFAGGPDSEVDSGRFLPTKLRERLEPVMASMMKPLDEKEEDMELEEEEEEADIPLHSRRAVRSRDFIGSGLIGDSEPQSDEMDMELE